MKLINKLNRYLEDKNYQIIIKDSYVNIINIQEIIDFSIDQITVKCNNQLIVVEGKNLTISKMLEDEVLILGTIYNVRIK